jgi:hypothetical protein
MNMTEIVDRAQEKNAIDDSLLGVHQVTSRAYPRSALGAKRANQVFNKAMLTVPSQGSFLPREKAASLF